MTQIVLDGLDGFEVEISPHYSRLLHAAFGLRFFHHGLRFVIETLKQEEKKKREKRNKNRKQGEGKEEKKNCGTKQKRRLRAHSRCCRVPILSFSFSLPDGHGQLTDTYSMSLARTTQPLLNQMASNSEAEFTHADSIYIDSKMSGAVGLDDTYISQSVPNESDVVVASDENEPKNARNRREERQLRNIAEQLTFLRGKFDLKPSENLIAYFSAAILRHRILIQGRIFITTSYICFYSRIFGKVTKDSFEFTSIKRVKKRRGGLVNAIKISFLDDAVSPVVLASLNNREKVLELIQDRLRVLNPAAAERKDDDEGSVASAGSARDDSDGRSVEGNDAYQSNPTNGSSITLSTRNSIENAHPDTISARDPSKDHSDADSAHDVNTSDDFQSKLIWQTPDDVMGRVSSNSYDKKNERARVVLDAPVKEVFNILYMSDWLKKYHEDVKNRDVTISDWERGEDGFMKRQVDFRRPLGYKIGPKETRVKETHRYSFTKDGGVLIEIQGENLDVPYASCFFVESFFELDPCGNAARQTLMVASVAVHFVKSTFLQGTIESGALNETKTTFQRLACMAKDRISQHNAEKLRNRVDKLHAANRVHFKPNSPSREGNGHHADHPTDTACTAGVPDHRTNNTTDDPVDIIDADDMELNRSTERRPSNDWKATEDGVWNSSYNESRPRVQDVGSSRILRLATFAILVVTCLLLVSVLFTLRRLHHSIATLEGKIIRQESWLSGGDGSHCNSSL